MWNYTYTFDTVLPCNTISRGMHVMTNASNNILDIIGIESYTVFDGTDTMITKCHPDMVVYAGIECRKNGTPIHGRRTFCGYHPHWLGLCNTCKHRTGGTP